MRKIINPNKVNIEKVAQEEQEKWENFRAKKMELIRLTMKKQGVDYHEARKLINKCKVATLIAIEFSMLTS